MAIADIITAGFLGVIEGLTEFLPVSSTAHLVLISHALGFSTAGETFPVLIQLGAILAVLGVYLQKIIYLISNITTDKNARHFVMGLIIAFIPSVIIGLLAHKIIKSIFFETPILICTSLIIGGFILLWVDRQKITITYNNAEQFSFKTYFIVGLSQCLAMIPGVSRSGATIVSAMLMGSDKRAAAEFSFFLAMPTMMGAFTLDLYKNYDMLNMNDISLIATGFITAFLSALFVVKTLLHYVTKYGFAPFAFWRIGVGIVGLCGIFFA